MAIKLKCCPCLLYTSPCCCYSIVNTKRLHVMTTMEVTHAQNKYGRVYCLEGKSPDHHESSQR